MRRLCRGASFGVLVGASLAVLPLGCSSSGGSAGGGGALSCEWLAGDNCWKQTAMAAASCLPPADASGTLSADGRTCTYANGVEVAFATPIVLPLPDGPTWNFTISNGGQTCLHYEDVSDHVKLVVGGQTVTEGSSGAFGVAITCPDGATRSNPNALQLLSCDADGGAFLGGLPGGAWSDSSSAVSFSLLSTSSTSSAGLSLFDCRR